MITPDPGSERDPSEVERVAVQVEGRFRSRREPTIMAALIAAFLVLAVLKPWSLGGDGGSAAMPSPMTASRSPSASFAAPTPTPTAGPVDPDAMDCLTDAIEQIVLIERWPGHEVRNWIAATDLADASGPLDPRLIPTVVFSDHVVGLGVCAPLALDGADGPAAILLDVTAIDGARPGPGVVRVGRPAVITRPSSRVGQAVLYGPPRFVDDAAGPAGASGSPSLVAGPGTRATHAVEAAVVGATAAWPLGAYSIGFRFASDAPEVVRLIRVDLVRGASASD